MGPVLIVLVAVAAFSRMLPHPPNFTPLAAIALLSGAYAGRRWAAYLVPFVAMLIADYLIGFHSTLPFVYACLALSVWMGERFLQERNAKRIFFTGLSSSLIFFLVTNFAVWLVGDIYPRTAAGLATCFVAALPFLKNSLAGDFIYIAGLFSAAKLAERWLATKPQLKPISR